MTKQLETDIFNYHTPEFFINMKDIPDKTSKERKSFVLEEKRKCREGININGVFIPGGLYFHLNYYHLDGDDPVTDKKVISLPRLRDNEWIVFNDYAECYEKRLIYPFFGLRQAGKSEMIVSLCLREISLFKSTEAMALFASDPDKDTFVKKISTAITHGEKFMIIPNIDKDWSKNEIRFGYTKQDNTTDLRARLFVYNTQEGKKIQIGSGKSLSFLLLDEIAKSPWKAVYDVIEPALLADSGKLRCSSLFTFTGGEVDKARDAEIFVKYPSDKKQFITILDDGKKIGGRFLDGRYRKDCKFPMDFSTFIGKKTDTWLDSYKIYVSDFSKAEAVIEEERADAEASPDPSTLTLKKIFFPLTIDEVFLTTATNNFPLEAIIQRQDWLKENYNPERIEFYRDTNLKTKWKFSSLNPITKFPVNQSDNKIAPVLIFEYPIEGLPLGTYCMGVDSFNSNESSDRVNSLGTIYVLKRTHDPLGKFQYHIVASYAGRPKLVTEFYEICEMMQEFYNAYVLPETNQAFIDHFINKQKGHVLWDTPQLSIDIKNSPFSSKMTAHKKGLNPTPTNQQFGMDLAVTYNTSPVDWREDDGNVYRVMGVNRIYDYMLLEEEKNYKSKPSSSKGIHDGNFDRIIAFYHALILANHLDKYLPMDKYMANKNKKEEDNWTPTINSPFSSVNRQFSTTNKKTSRSPFLSL